MKTLRILYLEDTDYDVDLVREYLEEDKIVYDLIHVKTRRILLKPSKKRNCISFLQISPYHHLMVWKHWILRSN